MHKDLLDNLFTLELTPFDAKKNRLSSVQNRIFEILTNSSLRIGSLGSITKKMLSDKIASSIEGFNPIHLVIAFGGFKGVKIRDSPNINWAEVFHLSFLLKNLWQISLVYSPGLILEFSGDDLVMPIIDNHKKEWATVYQNELTKLLRVVSLALPINITLLNRPVSSFYKYNFIEKEITNEIEGFDLESERIQQHINWGEKHAWNNFVFDGEQDYSKTSEKAKQELIIQSVLKHRAYLDVDYRYRGEYLEGGIHIPVAHRKGIPGTLAIRSTKSSAIQFWESYGVLVDKKDKTYPHLLSGNQFEELKDNIQYEKVSIEFLKEFDTLKSIPVLKL